MPMAMAKLIGVVLRAAWLTILLCSANVLLVAMQQLSSEASPISFPAFDDPHVAVVSTGLELAVVLANASKSWAYLRSNVNMSDQDWSNISTPVLRYTNFTISGTPSPDKTLWPVLGLGFVKDKIRLEGNTTLLLQYLVVRDFRATPLGQSPGFDIVEPSTTDAGALVAMQDTVLMLRICVPRDLQAEIMVSIARPINLNGTQLTLSNVSQSDCTNDTTSPLVSRCWPDLGVYLDVAVAGFDIDAFGRATATRYALYMLRVPYLCERQMTSECVSQLRPLGCFFYMFPRTSGSAVPIPPSSPSLQLPPPVLTTVLVPTESKRNLVAITAGGAVGGTSMFVLVALGAAMYARRRRPSEEERKSVYKANLRPSPSADGNQLTVSRQAPGNGSPPPSLDNPPSSGAHKFLPVSPPGGLSQQPVSSSHNITLPSGVGTCVLSNSDVDASSPLVIVTPFTPHRSDLKLDVQCDTDVKLLPIIRGKGSYGRVVEGLYGGQRVAVKLVVDVDEWSGPTESPISSFAQEVEVLGRCQHPNIVRLLAACLKPPRLCLVMELMDTSLERLVHGKSGELLPLPTVLHIAADIARGLAYLHPTIVHRDLKPGNVLLSNTDSPRPIVKLTDFGLSRLRSTVLVTRHPEAGTPAYMAPEAFDASNYVITHKADIYALGVILWEMLTGSMPWDGCSMVAIAYSITVRHHRLPLSKLNASRCPPKLRKLIHQCWDPDPQRRPAAAELVKQLTLVLQLIHGDGDMLTSTGSSMYNNASADNLKLCQTSAAISGNAVSGAEAPSKQVGQDGDKGIQRAPQPPAGPESAIAPAVGAENVSGPSNSISGASASKQSDLMNSPPEAGEEALADTAPIGTVHNASSHGALQDDGKCGAAPLARQSEL